MENFAGCTIEMRKNCRDVEEEVDAAGVGEVRSCVSGWFFPAKAVVKFLIGSYIGGWVVLALAMLNSM
jgi:hypothetical protein